MTPPADLLTFLQNNAANQPDKLFLVFENERLTYGEFAARVAGTAAGLRAQGIRSGERVAVAAYAGVDVFVAAYALQWLGATPVLASASLLGDLAGVLEDTRAAGLIYGAESRPKVQDARGALSGKRLLISLDGDDGIGIPFEALRTDERPEAAPRAPDGTSGIIFTAGTTGRPKPILRSYSTDLWDGIQKTMIYRLGFNDVWLYITPRNLTALIGPTRPILVTGSTYVVIDGFSPTKVAEVCARERVSQLTLLSGQWAEFLDLESLGQYDLSALRQVAAAASQVPEDIRRRLSARFGSLPMLQVYGTSEAGMVAASQEGDARAYAPACVGRPLPTVQVRIWDEAGDNLPPDTLGEVVVRGPGVSPGYDNRPDATATAFVDGWVRTGDVGRLDADGYLYLLGRMSDAFSVNGKKVYPSIAQEAMFSVDGVLEAAFAGVPRGDEMEPVAFVVPKRGAKVNENAVREAVHQAVPHLSAGAIIIVVLPSLPRTAAGKVDTRTLIVGHQQGRTAGRS